MEDKINILEIKDAFVKSDSEEDVDLQDISMIAAPGSLLHIYLKKGASPSLFLDLAEGMIVPDPGMVLFRGVNWADMKPYEVANARARIGRVFEKNRGWIRNLSLFENAGLSMMHHMDAGEEAINKKIQEMASLLGIEKVLNQRPENVRESDARKAEWLRAFITRRDLILLQQPGAGVHENHYYLLSQLIDDAVDMGSAVVVLDYKNEIEQIKTKHDVTAKYELSGTELFALEDKQ